MCMLNSKTSFPIPNVLTAYYRDEDIIKGIVCASGCTKSKVVKRKFEDQDNIPAAADNAADNAAADAAPTPASAADPPATPPDRGASLGPTQDPSPAGKGGKGAKPAGAGKKGGKGQG